MWICFARACGFNTGTNKDNMIFSVIALKVLLVALQIFNSEALEPIVTEQEASTLSPGRLIVQLVTEPESLIRLFEGLNLSFQMLRHYGRTGSALLRLPFNRDFLYPEYDYIGLDPWKRPYYARMPTRFPAEAPRYVKMSPKRSDDMTFKTPERTAEETTFILLNTPYQRWI